MPAYSWGKQTRILISQEDYNCLAKVEVPVWMEITRPDGESMMIHTVRRGVRKTIRDFMKGKQSCP